MARAPAVYSLFTSLAAAYRSTTYRSTTGMARGGYRRNMFLSNHFTARKHISNTLVNPHQGKGLSVDDSETGRVCGRVMRGTPFTAETQETGIVVGACLAIIVAA